MLGIPVALPLVEAELLVNEITYQDLVQYASGSTIYDKQGSSTTLSCSVSILSFSKAAFMAIREERILSLTVGT